MRAKIVEILNKIKTDIEANIDASGVSATGKSRNSLSVVEYDTGVKLVSSFKYFAVLETGRRPGKMPPTKPIEDWIYARGLQKETDAKTRGFAFAIARKIGAEGYGRPTPPQLARPGHNLTLQPLRHGVQRPTCLPPRRKSPRPVSPMLTPLHWDVCA